MRPCLRTGVFFLTVSATCAVALRKEPKGGKRNLALVDIPLSFGDVVSAAASLSHIKNASARSQKYLSLVRASRNLDAVHQSVQPNAELWGNMIPHLRHVEPRSGCQMANAPPRLWSPYDADKYFGQKVTFGILRNPYERMVAIFRESQPVGCDVNKAVKQWLSDKLLGRGHDLGHVMECQLGTQAEYFEKPFGITVPLDSRDFPQAVNDLLRDHGYEGFHIRAEDLPRVTACPGLSAADLDARSRWLVKRIYRRDFELLCRHFGACDDKELSCLPQIPGNCPPGGMPQPEGEKEEEEEEEEYS